MTTPEQGEPEPVIVAAPAAAAGPAARAAPGARRLANVFLVGEQAAVLFVLVVFPPEVLELIQVLGLRLGVLGSGDLRSVQAVPRPDGGRWSHGPPGDRRRHERGLGLR